MGTPLLSLRPAVPAGAPGDVSPGDVAPGDVVPGDVVPGEAVAPGAPAVEPLVAPAVPDALDPPMRAFVSMNGPLAARAAGAPAAAVLPLVPVAPEVLPVPLCRQPVTVTTRF